MGVKGLWKLIEDAGTPVPIESLEQKILAVDVSIWIHQAVRGFKGDPLANSHLLTLFHRICKLLFYRIRPVFVFDGGVPQLKKQTMSHRRVRREAAANRVQQVRERLLKNLLKSHAVRNVLGRSGPTPSEHRVLPPEKPQKRDMFELDPLPDDVILDPDVEEPSVNKEKLKRKYQNLHDFDLESEEFKSLPLQKRHEILTDLQDSRKDNSWAKVNKMPSESGDFSSYQMGRLLKRSKFQETVDDVRSSIQKEKSLELEKELFGDLEKHVSQSYKIASEDASHSVVVSLQKEADEKCSLPPSMSPSSPVPREDFLMELQKQGLFDKVNDEAQSYASDCDSDYSDDSALDKIDMNENKALVNVMNFVMDDGFSQDEIMEIIEQTKDEVDKTNTNSPEIHRSIPFDSNMPSTSKYPFENITEVVNNNTVLSSDSEEDDDFIEVPDDVDGDEKSLSVESNYEDVDNIGAIRTSASSSLYIKIVQHKLDEMIESGEGSPNKAKIDTRNINNENLVGANTSKKLTVDVDFQTNEVDDMFSDIFCSDINRDTPVVEELMSDVEDDSDVEPVIPEKILQRNVCSNSLPSAVTENYPNHCNNSTHENVKERKDATTKKSIEEDIVVRESKKIQQSAYNDSSKNSSKITDNALVNDDIQKKVNELVKMQVEKMMTSLVSKSVLDYASLSEAGEETSLNENCTKVIKKDESSTSMKSVNDFASQSVNDSVEKELIEGDQSASISISEKTFSLDKTEFNDSNHSKSVEPISEEERQSLERLENKLTSEQQLLKSEVRKSERIASNLSQQMYTDAQELLRLFGIPYLVAPMEAEAQCAFLEKVKLTHGTITDDSDALLFGSAHIFKNFFNQSRHVEHFQLPNIKTKYGLDRVKLISLALLTGSDYTDGIDGIGAVSALEVLSEFSGEGIEILRNFKKWWNSYSRGVTTIALSKVKQKLAKIYLPEGFPNEEIYKAYTEPSVEESREKFTWGEPNVEGLIEFTNEKMGWNRNKTEEILIPVLKRLKLESHQTRIESYFNVQIVKEPTIVSKRLKEAIAKSKGDFVSPENSHSKTKIVNNPRVLNKKGNSAKNKGTRSRKPENVSSSSIDDVDKIKSPKEIEAKINQKLYKKDTIKQREDAMKEMEDKKKKAALILKKSLNKNKK